MELQSTVEQLRTSFGGGVSLAGDALFRPKRLASTAASVGETQLYNLGALAILVAAVALLASGGIAASSISGMARDSFAVVLIAVVVVVEGAIRGLFAHPITRLLGGKARLRETLFLFAASWSTVAVFTVLFVLAFRVTEVNGFHTLTPWSGLIIWIPVTIAVKHLHGLRWYQAVLVPILNIMLLGTLAVGAMMVFEASTDDRTENYAYALLGSPQELQAEALMVCLGSGSEHDGYEDLIEVGFDIAGSLVAPERLVNVPSNRRLALWVEAAESCAAQQQTTFRKTTRLKRNALLYLKTLAELSRSDTDFRDDLRWLWSLRRNQYGPSQCPELDECAAAVEQQQLGRMLDVHDRVGLLSRYLVAVLHHHKDATVEWYNDAPILNEPD